MYLFVYLLLAVHPKAILQSGSDQIKSQVRSIDSTDYILSKETVSSPRFEEWSANPVSAQAIQEPLSAAQRIMPTPALRL